MRRWIVTLLICLMSCHVSHAPSRPPHVLRININREPPTMDPRRGSEWIGSAMHFLLFEGLMRLNPDGTLTPAQARSVEISDDRMTYTFHLRDTLWSNGTPVTAKDFECAWKKIIDPEFGAVNAHLLYPIKNAEKARHGEVSLDHVGIYSKDDRTFIVQLEKPTPYFLDLISFCLFFPVPHLIDEQNPHWMEEASPQFVSNGPFTLRTWQHNREIVVKKNSSYWEAPLIDLDEIRISMIANETTALNMYEQGQLDIIGMVISPLPIDALHHFYKQGIIKNQSAPATTFISFNTGRFPFTNKHIRKAFSYAVDRTRIVQDITQLGEDIATNVIPPALRTDPSRSFFQDHDIARARAELKIGLAELKIDALPRLTLQYSSNELSHKIAQFLQEEWSKALGIKVALERCEHKILLDNLSHRTYELATAYWFAQYRDPVSILERFKTKTNAKNYPDWENEEFSRLLEKSVYDNIPEKRTLTLEAAEALLLEEMPLAPLYHWQTSFMMKDYVHLKNLKETGSFDYARVTLQDPPP